MAEPVERVVTELIAKVDGFDGKIKTSAAAFDGSMKKIEASGARAEAATGRAMVSVERSMGRAAQSSRNLGFQISDISTQLAAGTSPFLILAQQGPQVANALDGAKGKIGAFATFLSGPWGAALLGATTLLGVFGSKLFDSGEEAKKSSNANELFADKLDRTKHSLDEVIAAVKEYNDVQAKAQETTLGMAQASAVAASKNIEEALSIRKKLEARLADAKLSADIASQQGEGEALAVALTRVSGLQGEIDANTAKLRDLEVQARASVINVASEMAKLDTDPTEKIKLGFTLLRTQARQTIKDVDALRKALADLNRQEEAALDRQREKERKPRASGTGLPKVTGQEVARLIGAPITSGTRTAAQNKAAGGAANSYHLSGQAIDIPLTVNGHPLTKAGIRAALEPAGVIIKELLGPGDKGHSDHFHVAFDKRRAGPDQVASTRQKAEDAAARLVEARAQREQRVANEEASLDEQILRQRREIAVGAAAQAKLELDAIDVAEKTYRAQLDALVDQNERSGGTKGITQAEAYILELKHGEIADIERQRVNRREEQRVRQENLNLATSLLDNDLERLRAEEGLATSQKERRRIALAIVDSEAERLKISIEAAIKEAEINGASEEILAAMRARLANLGTIKANNEKGAKEDTASPIESYIGDIQKTADDLDTAFENIAVGGLKAVSDGLVDAIVNFRSLGDVARAVLQQILGQLLQIVIQMLIMKAIKAIFGGFADGGPVGSHSLGGGLASGGPIGFPGGGPVFGAGTATSDSIPARLSNGEYVIKAKSAAKLGRHALDMMNLTGELPMGYAAGGPMRAVRPVNGMAATAGAAASVGMDDDFKRELRSVVAEAAASQPDVNLYPTLSPKRAMEEMLKDPGAQRTLFGFLSNNSGRANTALRR